MPGPLEGVKVLDLTRLIVGGFYGMLLADAGAEVVNRSSQTRGHTTSLEAFLVESLRSG
jgi:crotonobetainyl-CoA:carnitine CoA-transferase CaiB-like acyl-CoA transferase